MPIQNCSVTKGDYLMQMWCTKCLLFIFLWLGLGACAVAEDAPWYEVEVIVFEHVGAAARAGTWLQDAGTIDSGRASPGFASAQTPKLLDRRSHRLSGVESTLAASKKYRPIVHLMWRQPAYPARRAQPVAITSPDGSQLTGTVRLSRSRYLHFETNLFYRKTAYGNPEQGFRLKDHRRINNGELAYFDHPVFGMLVMATRLQRPGEQVEQEPVDEPANATETKPGEED